MGGLAGLEEEDGNLAEVEVNEVLQQFNFWSSFVANMA